MKHRSRLFVLYLSAKMFPSQNPGLFCFSRTDHGSREWPAHHVSSVSCILAPPPSPPPDGVASVAAAHRIDSSPTMKLCPRSLTPRSSAAAHSSEPSHPQIACQNAATQGRSANRWRPSRYSLPHNFGYLSAAIIRERLMGSRNRCGVRKWLALW